ncbi:MAG TPA: thioredoxin domain-containing protein [Candidatus Eremiobacteraceae bacterium]|nr:thioredoxin domain-containing protein [Candidatus Eremiobacteraceae bacterium]
MRKILFLLAVGLFTSAAFAQSLTLADNTVVAEVNGDKLTTADLEHQEGSKLLQSRYAYYEVQRKALDELIDQHLLEIEAHKQNLTVEKLLDREVNSKLPPDATDDQLQVYYEGLETDKPFDKDMKDKIRQHIHDARVAKLKTAYLKTLRSQARIMVELAPPEASVSIAGAPLLGPKNAPVVLVEFADYQCPYCQKVNPDLEKLQKEFGDKLAIAFKDFPLPAHPFAEKAAEAARCAGEQGKFWEFHNKLFEDKKLEPADLKQEATALQLNTTKFDACLDSGAEAAVVQKDAGEGKALGLAGTPSFFANGHFFSGAMSYDALRDMVAQQLKAQQAKGSQSSIGETSPMESSLR